jgi:hypothetical protein
VQISKNCNILACCKRISIPRSDLETAKNSRVTFLTHEHDLKIKSWCTEILNSKKCVFFYHIRALYWIKKSKSEIFTPKFKSFESIWTVLAVPCKKSPNKSKLWFFCSIFLVDTCLANISFQKQLIVDYFFYRVILKL